MAKLHTDSIPEHLQPFVAQQDPTLYTAMDHAGWRYIMRVSKSFFKGHAHQKYLDGLRETGISTEQIPLITEMDQCLRRFGWRAVGVVGFIPPAAFMEFQSLGFLPIACDMRQLEHLAYTPAPDIVHEAAGHAPIIADPDYARYLRAYGEVARKAIFSKKDMEVYTAIRNLSDVKEDPTSSASDIRVAQDRLDRAVSALDYVSEATYLARMNWWTVEYGLIGDLNAPLIYGAGLLSSVSESFNCLKEDVKKIPLTLDCLNISYDITRPQPQLFVTPDFATLTHVLEEVADRMAFRRGGIDGLAKAKLAETPVTAVLDSGLQISGVLGGFRTHTEGSAYYLQFTGPTQLAYQDQEIENQGPTVHAHGFGSPIGKLSSWHGGISTVSDLSESDLKKGEVRFESGVCVKGTYLDSVMCGGKRVIARFENCTVTQEGTTLFQPEWGVYDMACGTRVVSVFGGAADRGKYLSATGKTTPPTSKPKTNLTPKNKPLCELYQKVRDIRTGGAGEVSPSHFDILSGIVRALEKDFQEDWLLRLELLELNQTHHLNAPWVGPIEASLQRISKSSTEKATLIARGLALLAS